MALSFKGKAAPSASQASTTANSEAPSHTHQTATASPSTGQSKPGKFSWMKTGKAAQDAQKHEEMKAQQAKDAANRMRRFRLKEGKEARVTFLDGVMEEGILEIPKWYEHSIEINGRWKQFVCTAEIDQSQACPICTAGDKADYVGALTLINHTPYVIQEGPNAGKTLVNQRQLFVGKLGSIAALSKIAAKRGGTRGLVMDISRTGDKKPAVGDVFDVVDGVKDWKAFMQKYDLKVEDIQPAEYENENPYIPVADLIALGVGKAHIGPGTGNQKASGAMADHL